VRNLIPVANTDAEKRTLMIIGSGVSCRIMKKYTIARIGVQIMIIQSLKPLLCMNSAKYPNQYTIPANKGIKSPKAYNNPI
jgi:hypothetical protein